MKIQQAMVSAVMVILSLAVGRGPIKSQDTQRAHVIPNSHFGPRTDYQGFKGNLIGSPRQLSSKNMPHWNSVGRMVLLSKPRQTPVKTGSIACLVR